MKLYLQNGQVVYDPKDYIEMEAQWPKITKDTTPEEVMEIHRRIWDYVVKHGEKPITPYRSDCAFCEHVKVNEKHCYECLADWSGYCPRSFKFKEVPCVYGSSIFWKWKWEKDPKKKKLLAFKIKNVHMKERYKKQKIK